MLNIIQIFKQWRTQKKKRKLFDKPARSLKKFKKHYPNYSIASNCYGVPIVKHPHPDSTLRIGAYCSFAKNVQIFLGGHHRTDWITTYRFPVFFEKAAHIKNSAVTNGSVLIGNDVWLCENCTILSGVTIGDGAVVANGAIVTKDVPAYAIVGGNPAKLIRWRFDEPTRSALLESRWWEWPQEEILSIVDLLCSNNLEAFIEYTTKRTANHVNNI